MDERFDVEECLLAPGYKLIRRFGTGVLPMERWELWYDDELLAYFPTWIDTAAALELATEITRIHRARTNPPS